MNPSLDRPTRGPGKRAVGFVSELRAVADRAARKRQSISYESYRDDPVGFCRDVLGFVPWEGQARVLRALAGEKDVTVPAGRAVGKSRLDAAAALWFACTRGQTSRVICTGPTNQVVQNVFWEEVRRLFAFSKLKGDCAVRCSTGARLADGGQILGIVAEKPEGFQGIRAPDMLVIVDEASGVTDDMFQVIEGNMAGGSKFLLTGNPTRTQGYFRDSLKSDRFDVIELPSTESPNIKEGREIVKGLATLEWLEARKREWGEDSPLYKIHVLGQVAEGQEGRLFSAEMIAGAEARWKETPPTGGLVIGLDPAGSSGDGDESAFAARRGRKVIKLHARRGLTEAGHLTELLGLISMHRGDSTDTPTVVIDRDGLRRRARVRGSLRVPNAARGHLPPRRRARRRESAAQAARVRPRS